MKAIAILAALSLASCVTTVSPDGTKTTSFAPSVDQINATQNLITGIRSHQIEIGTIHSGPVYGPQPITPTK